MASFVMEAILALETGSLLLMIAFSCRSTRNVIRYHMHVFHDSKIFSDQKLCLNRSTYLTSKVGHSLHDFDLVCRQLDRRVYHLLFHEKAKIL